MLEEPWNMVLGVAIRKSCKNVREGCYLNSVGSTIASCPRHSKDRLLLSDDFRRSQINQYFRESGSMPTMAANPDIPFEPGRSVSLKTFGAKLCARPLYQIARGRLDIL